MAVDGIDDAVALAYNAWPERIYILRSDGRIHYKGGLGPFGFRPAEADQALAKLLGVSRPTSESAEPEDADAAFEDDGISGVWRGQGEGSTTGGKPVPFRILMRVAKDGTVSGRVEAGKARKRLLLKEATFDRASGKLRASTRSQGQALTVAATLEGDVLEGELRRPEGPALFAYELKRVRKAAPLVPGVENATGLWHGEATDTDPAQAGKAVELVLTEAYPEALSGSITIDGETAHIERGRYDAKTGALSGLARTDDGTSWRIVAQIEGTRAKGSASIGNVALVVPFTLVLEGE